MRRLAFLSSLLLVAACGGTADRGAMDGADTAAVAAMPEMISLADVAGTWDVKGMMEGSDSVVLTFQIMADSAGWMYHLPGQEPVMAQATASGDSIMTSASHASALRAGVQVSTTSVFRMENGMLMGTTTARYDTDAADSVVTFRLEGTRAQ